MLYADAFHLAKWLVKHEAVSSGYVTNFIPSEAGSIQLSTAFKPQNVLGKLPLYLPTLNSLRKICSKSEDQQAGLSILQSDTNLYRVFADLLKTPSDDSNTVSEAQILPKTFRSAIKLIEEEIAKDEDNYFNVLIAHEIKQIYESAAGEVDRVN